MKEKIIGYDVIEFLSKSLALRFKLNGRDFTHVIGIARGGMIPATIMSYIFDAKLYSYGVSSYDGKKQTNLTVEQDINFDDLDSNSKILVVDDICDTGDTIEHLKEKIGSDRFELVRYATLFAKKDSQHKVDHFGVLVNSDTWLVFPWEK